ncbi:MAG TPA: rod-binding protein [Symbiobacteriaceae bacterium]|nr:rod-binding protein [Symbiobacteriaceae bacterium]
MFYLVADKQPSPRPVTATRQPDRLREAAEQMESVFVEMLLKQMRQSNTALGGEKPGFARSTYESWQDQHQSRSIAGAGGLGLAKILYQQLQQGTSPKR